MQYDRKRVILSGKEEDEDITVRKMRYKCLRLISEIGVNTTEWENVNRFMLNKHVCGRHLYELNEDELRRFRTKLYAIRDEVERRKEIRHQNILEEQRMAALN